MSSFAIDDPTRAALAQTMAPFAATVAHAPRSTIMPPRMEPGTTGRRALADLANIDTDRGLVIEDVLGVGGMGIVHAAMQRSVGRRVAVKRVRGEHEDSPATLALLQEAWVAGSLEHPNVLPIYDIVIEGGVPMIVMRRIEGERWSDVLGDPERLRARTEEAPLVWHLQVFLEVCDAVRFAHARGIVHRDIKPDNVMLGRYGEVYLLDWGIAVSLVDDGSGRVPLAAKADAVAGTPAYMAPEMLAGNGSLLGRHTDVYLLGATLFEIIVGRAPHRVDNLAALVLSMTEAPELPPEAPQELAAICCRAMAPERRDRYPDVDALEAAVRGFLRHRGSAALSDRAWNSLAELEREIARGGSDPAAARKRLYDLFSACRFGFSEALAGWPDNTRAHEGWRRAVLAMIEHELSLGDPGAAAALLGELAEAPAELAARIERALAARAGEQRELAQLRESARQLDKSIGARTRSLIGGVLGVLWIAFPLVTHFAPQLYDPVSTQILTPLVLLLLAGGLGFWARESMMKTAINRRVITAVIFMLAIQVLSGIGNIWIGASPIAYQTNQVVIWTAVCGLMAINVERLLWWPTLAYSLAFLAGARWPEARFLLAAGANVVLIAALLSAWRPTEGWRQPAPP